MITDRPTGSDGLFFVFILVITEKCYNFAC